MTKTIVGLATLLATPLAFGAPSGSTLPAEDRAFVEEAASGGKMEVELGRLAEQKAKDAQVKAFGRQMVQDHSKANERLRAVAKSEKLELSDAMLPQHQDEVNRLRKLSGPEFDREYTNLMHTDHVEDVKKFENEAKSGQDPRVKQFAQETLPTLQRHLKMASDLQAASAGARSGMGSNSKSVEPAVQPGGAQKVPSAPQGTPRSGADPGMRR